MSDLYCLSKTHFISKNTTMVTFKTARHPCDSVQLVSAQMNSLQTIVLQVFLGQSFLNISFSNTVKFFQFSFYPVHEDCNLAEGTQEGTEGKNCQAFQTQTAKKLDRVARDPIIRCDQSSRKKRSEADVSHSGRY